MRKVLDELMPMWEYIQCMGENNNEAIKIIDDIYKKRKLDIVPLLLQLNNMNIRGIQIVYGYNICNKNIDKFTDTILHCNCYIVSEINNLCNQNNVLEKAKYPTQRFLIAKKGDNDKFNRI